MNRFSIVIYDVVTGEITSQKSGLDDAELAVNVPPGRGYVLGEWDFETHYIDVVYAEAIARPVAPEMTAPTFDLSILDPSAKLVVTDEEGFETEVEAQPDTLDLIDPGVYRVRSESPFPWIDFDVEVIVT